MKLFRCACGAQTFFDNTQCLTCGRELGFVPTTLQLITLKPDENGHTQTPRGRYKKCANYVQAGVCNWMVPHDAPGELCQACELNDVIPDLSKPENLAMWQEVERAKRRLIYSLNGLGLPVISKQADPDCGLSFDIKSNEGDKHVLTGHSDGLITLNLDEANTPAREKLRESLKERYRTLLGHFRHEIGHYFWDRLVRDGGKLEECRQVFGDDSLDYAAALKEHYSREPDPNYPAKFISNYAASHPWEDFAETFAHYLHMVDTLETATEFGFAAVKLEPEAQRFEQLMGEWYQLTVALNSLNRSMGQPDAYPFAISSAVKEKLRFIQGLIADHAARRASSDATFSSSTRAGPGTTELNASTAV